MEAEGADEEERKRRRVNVSQDLRWWVDQPTIIVLSRD